VTRARRLALEELAPYLLEVPADPRVFEPLELFGNDHPFEIEVGCGKGLFLLNSALAHPEVNFLGIELDRKYQLFAATRIAKRGLTNVRFAAADARVFLSKHLPPACCRLVHIYFPDPWWKQKHRKRRLFTPEFARACESVLLPSGRLSIATDVEDYFKTIVDVIAEETRLSAVDAQPGVADGTENFSTNFERKALLKGTAIHRAVYEKKG
jgi:tRNA (guanine-N7-)-methyltransferase